MPRPGQTPAPAFKRSPSMPYGSVGPANAARPQQPQQTQRPSPQTGQPMSEEEAFLFGPTLRPTEPLTAGVPFGPGAMSLPSAAGETDRDFMVRVVSQIAQTPGSAPELQGFLARVQQGL